MFQKWILNKIFHETRFSLISFLVRPQAGGESSVQSVGVNITNGTGGEDGGGGGYWIIQALHKTALHKMSWDMRQGCRDTLEALHTEQTTRKILQINSFANSNWSFQSNDWFLHLNISTILGLEEYDSCAKYKLCNTRRCLYLNLKLNTWQ